MADVRFNGPYLQSDRGFTKIAQILLGIFVCSALCANWYGGVSCFSEGKVGVVSGLNFIALVVNVVLFILNLCNIGMRKAEYTYNVLASVLFTIAAVLFIWYQIQYYVWGWIPCLVITVLIVFVLLYSWDSKRTRSPPDHLPI